MALEFPGDGGVVPSWFLQSTSVVGDDPGGWSLPRANTSSWYRIAGPRATVLAALIENDVYNESDLFFSSNLAKLRESDFQVPWLYRQEIKLPPLGKEDHLFLHVHGISSKADIFFNGAQIAFSSLQRGSYCGRAYELTPHVLGKRNALVVKAYPTDYLKDLAIGWADWNPHPPDSGMGLWRALETKLTGPVTTTPPRVTTTFPSNNIQEPLDVEIEVKTEVANHGDVSEDVLVRATIISPYGLQIAELSSRLELRPRENSTVGLTTTISEPQLWWPATWGSQPLYQVKMNVTLSSGALSDIVESANFGIRSITTSLNKHNDRQFAINGHPFQVRGAGYAPDIFLRFDAERVEAIFMYVLDMGLNTIRLEGKQEHPEFYHLADRMGLMIIAGWECCDKWEAWSYNEDIEGAEWQEEDYINAHLSMLNEAEMMQPHPSLLAFLIGSDYWPNERATSAYLLALNLMDWPNPVIASASKRGYPQELGSSGMKMDGPYDWVPPNYWYGNQFGAAFGFGSELGAGVGTPELSSLHRFLSPSDLKALWSSPDAGQYHLSPRGSVFHNRRNFNRALAERYGPPTNLEDYVSKAQMMDYEATRAQFEAFSARHNAPRPATGVIYWMLNGAWPSLHWQLIDYYLQPAGAYFGAKVGSRQEHVVYDYESRIVFIVNHSLLSRGSRQVSLDLVGLDGSILLHRELTAQTTPTTSKAIANVPEIAKLESVAFLRLILSDDSGQPLSRNVYWVSAHNDELFWNASNWYTTPVRTFVDFSPLSRMPLVTVEATVIRVENTTSYPAHIEFLLVNRADVPAFFVRLVLLDYDTGEELIPVFWSENYVTLLSHEEIRLDVKVLVRKGDRCLTTSGQYHFMP
ncbi:glycoside hydrolase superfamily [Aspergillus cavernicola]|uniref:Glycoside hydrolase superfamily n=1 Tax=Aspergillus cavernicola TaxID=176166 RepID=A0ABR4IEV3_9EURO